MTERMATGAKHAFAGFCMNLPDSSQRPCVFAELRADGQAKCVAWGKNLAAADGIIPNAWRQAPAGASFSLPMFELAIQHSGLKGFDALSEQPVISLMQWAFVWQGLLR
eukprot:363026-Chlamydomonas_euryale.AAC.3